MAHTFIGTSGWTYKHWRGAFYPPDLPQAQWFGYYARHFDTVEVNNTFYRLPEEGTFEAWRAQAPRGFVYAVKASRYITHAKKLKDPEQPLARLLDRAAHLGPSLGPILYQLPPNWRLNLERLEAFLAILPGDRAQVFEFRDPSWFAEEALGLLERYGVGFCVSDLPGAESPLRATGALAYIRLHGPARAYEGAYDERRLRLWATRARELMRGRRRLYVYFNNDAHGHAVRNALRLKELLS